MRSTARSSFPNSPASAAAAASHVTDREAFRSVTTVLAILQTLKNLPGAKLDLHGDYFDKVMGTSLVREAFERGEPFDAIAATWERGLAEFAKLRDPFLLYR